MNIKNGNYFAKDCVDGNDWSIYNFIIRESNNNIPVYYQYGYIYNTKDYENEKIFVKDIEKEDLNNLFISIGNNAKTMAQALLSKKLEVSKLVKEEFLITIATIGEVMKGCVVNSDWPLENFEIRIFIEKRKKIRRLKQAPLNSC